MQCLSVHINAIYSVIGSVDITDDHFLTSGVIGYRGCEGVQVPVEGSCGSYQVDVIKPNRISNKCSVVCRLLITDEQQCEKLQCRK